MYRRDAEEERKALEELLRDRPMANAASVRAELLEGDIDVSLSVSVEAAINDTTFGEPVTAAAVLPKADPIILQIYALGDVGKALEAAVGDGRTHRITGKMLVGDGGGDLLAVHAVIANNVRTPQG